MGNAHVKNQFSVNQVLTTAAGTTVSTNVIDTGAANVGDVNPINLEVFITEVVNNLTSVQFQIFDCDTEGGTYILRQSGPVHLLAALKPTEKPILVMPLVSGLNRYLQLKYANVGTTATTGKFTAQLVDRLR